MTFQTLAERKRLSAEQRAAAAEAVMAELSAYARSIGGRFIVFGSAASGRMRYDSDFDVIVDFPPAAEAAAHNAVEEFCGRHGLKPDVLPASRIDTGFIEQVLKTPVRVLP